MTEGQEITLGEIYRMCQANNAQLIALTAEVRERAHQVNNDVNVKVGQLATQMLEYIGPVAVLQHQVGSMEGSVSRLDVEVRDMGKQAAKVSVLGTIAALVMAIIPWPWKK